MSGDLDLWQQTLATEHSVIWGYGLVGATSPLALPASLALRAHRDRRARCIDQVVARGGVPAAAAPAYDLVPPRSVAEARALAASLEQSSTVAYAALSGAADRATRLVAAQWLRESAIGGWRWSREVPELPGLRCSG